MRSLKKLITLVLALAMVLTSVGITAMAASFSDITDEKVASAVDKLVAYKIITGYEDGTFRPDNQITRAEFAAIVTRMKGVADNLAADAVTGFSDLDNDASRAWARPYVKAAVDLKIINGFEDGTFRAGEPVTYEQAVKMLVCAVGYEVVAQSEYNKALISNPNATWSAGYIAAANKHGITKGVITAQISQPASRGVVAVLTSNALEVPELVTDEQGNLTKPEDGETESTMQTITGVVTGTFYTGVTSDETGLQEDEIYIDATDNDDDGEYKLADTLAESIDLDQYIGRRVNAYYDNLSGEITSMNITGGSSKFIEESSIESVSGYSIKYKNASGKTNTEDLSTYTFIVNGKYVDSYDLDTFKNGTIELFTSNSRKIAKVSSYEVFVVNSYNSTEEKVFLKYAKYNGNNYYQFPTRASDKPIIYVGSAGSEYKKTEFSKLSLSQYDVINYLESPSDSAGDPIRKMYVTKGAKTNGKVTAGTDGSEREVEINENIMYITQQYFDFTGDSSDQKAPFELSDSYTYYLDYTGQIAAVKYNATESTGSWSYGYLVEVDTRNNVVGIIDKDGNYKDGGYELKDSVTVDGQRTDAGDVFAVLEKSAGIIDANANSDILTKTNNYAQPIRYSLSGSKIGSIDTILDGNGDVATTANGTDDNFTYDGKTDKTTGSTTTTKVVVGGESFGINSSTIIFYVPKDRESVDSYDAMKNDAAFAVSKERYVEVFAMDSTTSKAKMVLVYNTNPTLVFTGSSPYMIVSKVSNTDDTQVFKGYAGGSTSETSITVSEDKFESSISNVSGSDIEKGDIIRYIKDNSGKIVAIQLLYDASTGGKLNVGKDNSFTDTVASDFVIKYGTADGKDGTDNTIDILCGDSTKTYKTENTKYFKLASNGEVTESSIDEVSVEIDGGKASTIVLISRTTSESNASATVIYIVE